MANLYLRWGAVEARTTTDFGYDVFPLSILDPSCLRCLPLTRWRARDLSRCGSRAKGRWCVGEGERVRLRLAIGGCAPR